MSDNLEDQHFRSPLDPGILWRSVYYFEKYGGKAKPSTFTLGVKKGKVVFGPIKYQELMNHEIDKVIEDFKARKWTITLLNEEQQPCITQDMKFLNG